MLLKELEAGRLVSQGFSKVWKAQESCLERNFLTEYYQAASESVEVGLIKSVGDVSRNNLPFFIQEEVINEIKTKSQES